MPEKPRSLSKVDAPDPSNVYERSHPENESGMGRLDNNSRATPRKSADHIADAVANVQDGSRQINAHDDAKVRENSVDETVGWRKKKLKGKRRSK